MLILPGLLETLDLSQSALNDPEAYVLPSLDDPHIIALSILNHHGFRRNIPFELNKKDRPSCYT